MQNSTSAKRQPGQRAKKPAAPKRGRIKACETFSPREVELMRDLYEFHFWGLPALAEKFETTEARVSALVKYKTHR